MKRMIRKILKWWRKEEKVDKISIVLGIIGLTYFLICWIDVITHNQINGYTYPWWNFFNLF